MDRTDVLVVGGGFIGLSAAAAFAAQGRSVTVLEARSGPDPRFRGELIHPRGARALASLGLAGPLRAAGAVGVRGFAAVPDAGAPAMLLPYDPANGTGIATDHPAMVALMRREVGARRGVRILTGQRVADVLREGGRVVGVRTAEGRELRAPLTVAADGRHSKLRELLGFAQDTTLLSYTVAVSVEGDVLPHTNYGHVFLGARGPILAYPVEHARVRMCIDVPTDVEKGRDALAALLRTEYAPFIPEPLRSAMLHSLATRPFELCANHSVRTYACAAPGVVLVGDAGGCSHPLTAGGMTIGLNDVLTLAEEVRAAGPSDDALARYQRRRYRFVRAREILTEALYEVFRAHDDGSRALRSGIFRYWKDSARGRAQSMALLACEDSRARAFVAEYALVVGLSTRCILSGEVDGAAARGRAELISALFRTSYGRLERTFELASEVLASERRATLQAVPPVAVTATSSRGAAAAASSAAVRGAA